MPSNRSLANLHISDAMIMFYKHKLTVQEDGDLILSESMPSTGIHLATLRPHSFYCHIKVAARKGCTSRSPRFGLNLRSARY